MSSLKPKSTLLSNSVGNALMVVRIHRGLSQVGLSQRLSELTCGTVTQGYVSKVETGRIAVSWARLAIFCQCLQCLPSQVVKLAEFLLEQDFRPDRDVIANLLQDPK